MMKNKTLFWGIFLFVIAFLLRAGFIALYPRHNFLSPRIYTADGDSYHGYAVSLLEKGEYQFNGLPARRLPGYPLFLAAIYKIFTPSPVTIRFFQALLGALSCFILFRITRSLFGLTAGWIAYIVSAFYYPLIQLSGYIMPEMFFIFLFLSFLYFLYRWHDTASPFYLIAT
ncbi:MAG: phospholipid carrier-dependent glycosyltransferase, partial [Caldiserica bacterium]|nr:phospholipid carrier-dependent glycosyltransferase [Caldisericota bacterium]